MSFYGSMKIAHVKAENENKLQDKLRGLEALHDSMIKVINVYRAGSSVVAWYYHDYKKAGMPSKQEHAPKTTKKSVRKKATKKAK